MKRIGVAFPGDPSRRATWSGTPAGVMRGLAAAGAEPVAIRAEPRPLVRALGANLIAAGYLRPRRDVKVGPPQEPGRGARVPGPGRAQLARRAAARPPGRAARRDRPDRDRLHAPGRRARRDLRGHDRCADQIAGLRGLGPAVREGVRRPRGAPAPRLRPGRGLLPHEPLGRRVGDPRLRHLAGEGPRGGRGPQPRRRRRGGATGGPALPVRRDGLGAQERRRGAPRLRAPAARAAARPARPRGGPSRGRATGRRRARSAERRRGRSQRAARAALRPGHLLRAPVPLGGVGDRLRGGRGRRAAEHRDRGGRLGLPDRGRRARRGPRRRRRPARGDAVAGGPGRRGAKGGRGQAPLRALHLGGRGPAPASGAGRRAARDRCSRDVIGAQPAEPAASARLSRAADQARARRGAPPRVLGARTAGSSAAAACVASPSATPSASTRAAPAPRCLRA